MWLVESAVPTISQSPSYKKRGCNKPCFCIYFLVIGFKLTLMKRIEKNGFSRVVLATTYDKLIFFAQQEIFIVWLIICDSNLFICIQ